MWQEEYDDAECAEWAQAEVARLVCRAGAAAIREDNGMVETLYPRLEKYMERLND